MKGLCTTYEKFVYWNYELEDEVDQIIAVINIFNIKRQLSCCLKTTAQLVERCTDVAEFRVQIPFWDSLNETPEKRFVPEKPFVKPRPALIL